MSPFNFCYVHIAPRIRSQTQYIQNTPKDFKTPNNNILYPHYKLNHGYFPFLAEFYICPFTLSDSLQWLTLVQFEKVIKSVRGNDKRFFNSSKKGEVGEWRKKLHSLDVTEVTNAMKCVIAAMTIGTDVSMLFPDVISCIHDKTLELKKLVYL